jgi:hypothetical protein
MTSTHVLEFSRNSSLAMVSESEQVASWVASTLRHGELVASEWQALFAMAR